MPYKRPLQKTIPLGLVIEPVYYGTLVGTGNGAATSFDFGADDYIFDGVGAEFPFDFLAEKSDIRNILFIHRFENTSHAPGSSWPIIIPAAIRSPTSPRLGLQENFAFHFLSLSPKRCGFRTAKSTWNWSTAVTRRSGKSAWTRVRILISFLTYDRINLCNSAKKDL